MRGALIAVTFVVAACQNDHGVTVTVHPGNAAVTKVRLYVGVGDSTTTDLTDDSMVTVTNAEYWTRDPGNEIDLLDVTNHGDVTFNYDTSETIPVVIAIGYDDQGQPIAAGVADTLVPATGRNDFLIYDITLVAADPFSQTSSPMQVGLWSPTTTDLLHASCAGIIDASKDHPYFVVLDNDQDCDGLLDGSAGECTPDIYHGTRGADPAKADCLFPTMAANGLGGACQLGGSPCTDATPVTMESCQPSTTCLPTSLCAAGVCPATHPKDFECAADLVASGVSVSGQAHYDCVIATDTSGKVCNNETLALDRPPTGGYDCTDFEIGDSTTALGNSIKQTNVTFNANSLDAAVSCAATIGVAGTPTNITQALSGFVNFTLKNTGGVAIPIVFTFNKAGCSVAAAHCALDVRTFDDPSQTRCAAGWQPPTPVDIATSVTDVSDPTLTDDQKIIFYVSGGAIYTATKGATGWMMPTSLGLLTVDNRSPDVTSVGVVSGTTLVYTAAVATNRSIIIATRSAVDMPFDAGVALVDPTISSFTAATFAPTNPNDASGTKRLIAAGNLTGGTQQLLDVTYLASTITSVNQITIMNGPTNPDKPHLTSDGLHLYFEGTDQGRVTLWVASRTTIDDQFTYAVELDELALPGPNSYSGGAWVGPNGRVMYFTQTNAQGINRIFTTTRANL
jgi:hypothetical protein